MSIGIDLIITVTAKCGTDADGLAEKFLEWLLATDTGDELPEIESYDNCQGEVLE